MPFADRDATRLYWRSDGRPAAPALLLLNSLGTHNGMWDAVVPLLHDHFHVLRMDTRGHGASDAPAGDYALAELAADALAVLDAAGVARASLCGLSLGGMMALEAALAAPERIERLVVCNSSAAVTPAPWLERAATVRQGGTAAIVDAVLTRFFSEGFRAADPPALWTARAALLGTSAQGYAGCCAAIAGLALLDRLPALQRPLLVVNGEHDVATPPAEHGERIVSAVPGALGVTLPTGHLSAIEEPAAFARAVSAFLQQR